MHDHDSLSLTGDPVFSVGELAADARALLEARYGHVAVEGEISNLSRPASGHVYFTLKDDRAQLRCALFRFQARRLKTPLSEGQQVQVRGRVSLYEPRGDFQLIAETVEPAGLGALHRAFEALKARLDAEGLFAPDRKRPIPPFPVRIGVITSASGAAIRDVRNVLARRYPAAEVLIAPAIVQGQAAVPSILAALDRIERESPDVLLLVRGGGSLEDLWAFNDEALARRLHGFPVPVICGVGHETDFTIADFVADLRAPTPSAAAELATPDGDALRRQLGQFRHRLDRALPHRLQRLAQRIDHLHSLLRHRGPGEGLANRRERLAQQAQRLSRSMADRLQTSRHRLERLEGRLARRRPDSWLRQSRLELAHLDQRLGRAIHETLRAFRDKLERQRAACRADRPLARLAERRERLTHLKTARGRAWQAQSRDRAQRLQRQVALLQAVSPLQVLARGYSIARDDNGEVIRQGLRLQQGQRINLTFQDARASCRVEAVAAMSMTPAMTSPAMEGDNGRQSPEETR